MLENLVSNKHSKVQKPKRFRLELLMDESFDKVDTSECQSLNTNRKILFSEFDRKCENLDLISELLPIKISNYPETAKRSIRQVRMQGKCDKSLQNLSRLKKDRMEMKSGVQPASGDVESQGSETSYKLCSAYVDLLTLERYHEPKGRQFPAFSFMSSEQISGYEEIGFDKELRNVMSSSFECRGNQHGKHLF